MPAPKPQPSASTLRRRANLGVLGFTVLLVLAAIALVYAAHAPGAGGRAGRFSPPRGYRITMQDEQQRYWSVSWQRNRGLATTDSMSREITRAIETGQTYAPNIDILTRTMATYNPGAPQNRQTTYWTLSSEGLRRVGESGPDAESDKVRYEPFVVELPPDIHAGQSWGTAGERVTGSQRAPYSLRKEARTPATAAQAKAGCLEVQTADQLHPASGVMSELWCPGRGPVTQDGSGHHLAPVAHVPPGSFTTAAQPEIDWRPDTWTAPGPMIEDPMLDDQGLLTQTGPGTLAWVTSNRGDLAFAEHAGNLWSWSVSAFPSGDIVSLDSFSDVVVATTGNKMLVAYDAWGRFLWERQFDDVINSAPVRLNDTTIAVAGMEQKAYALDIATGRELWAASLPGSIRSRPVLSPDRGLMVVTDTEGHLVALDTTNGRQRWSTDLDDPASQLLIVGDAVAAVVNEQHPVAYALADGKKRWDFSLHSILLQFAQGDGVALALSASTVGAIGATGDVLWSSRLETKAETVGVLAHRDSTAVLTKSELQVFDAAGRRTARWPIVDGERLFDLGNAVGVVAHNKLLRIGPA